MASDSARREDHFQKLFCQKRTLPSDCVKLGSEILYLFLAKNWSFVFCFVATLSDFGLLLIEANAFKEKII